MNTQLTEIIFILDRSGSMQRQLKAAISGFNNFLQEQKDTPGQGRLTLVLFNDAYKVPCQALPLEEVPELDEMTFIPRGNTALLDAMGRAIDELGVRLAATPESDRPTQVIVATLTDGLENTSIHFTLKEVAARIAHQRQVYNWEFFFLGANQDAIATAVSMNIRRNNSMAFAADEDGFDTSSKAISRKMISVRKASSGYNLSPQEQEDLTGSLSQIGRDEEEKKK